MRNINIIFSDPAGSQNWKWESLDEMLAIFNKTVCKVKSGGFCILDAVKDAFLYDFGEYVSHKKMKEQITHLLCTKNAKYIPYHPRSANSMVDEVQQFFETGTFVTSDVCDFLMSVISDAFNSVIHIYQQGADGKVKIHTLGGDLENPDKVVHLKFTHDNRASGGNHYDCIINSRSLKMGPSAPSTPPPVPSTSATPPAASTSVPLGTVYGPPPPPTDEFDLPAFAKRFQDYENIEIIDLTRDEGNSTQDSSYGTDEYPEMKKGIGFPMYLFADKEPVEVEQIPGDIDGLAWYKMQASTQNFNQKSSDLRHFLMRTSNRVGLVGKRKTGRCQGSYICANDKCSFLSTEGKNNILKFDNLRGNKVCRSCGIVAEKIKCPAIKMLEFNQLQGTLNVYHYGDHTCTPKDDRKKHDEYINEQIKKFPKMPPKQLQVHCIKEKVSEGDIIGAQQIGKKLSDTSRIRQLRSDMLSGEDNVETNSMEAVAIFKQACDKVDPFHIFEMNDSRMNDSIDFVFKTTRLAAEVGLLCDEDNPKKNCLQEEDVYFDGAHSRVRGYISLALWIFHTSMRRLLKLACMEVRVESIQTVAMFWRLWNRALKKAGNRSDTYVFNPRKIMVDSAGANYGGVKVVFGLDYMTQKLISCQWHFMHVMEQFVVKLQESIQEEFLELCYNLCKSTTIVSYQLTAARLNQMALGCQIMVSKLNWWHVRRWHVFGAFRNGPTHAGCNLAEIGNASWKITGTNLSLLEAAKDDISLYILQDEAIQLHRTSSIMVGGQGPNDLQRAAMARKKQRDEAKGLAEIVTSREAMKMQLEMHKNPEYFVPGDKSSHKPPKAAAHSVEAQPVGEPTIEQAKGRGRGRGRGKGKGRGRGRGKFSKLPTAGDLARRILEAEALMNDSVADFQTQPENQNAPANAETAETPSEDDAPVEAPAPAPAPAPVLPPRNLLPEDQSYAPRRSTRGNNPPFVMLMEKTKYRCLGCNQWIMKKNHPHPRDLIFTLKAIRPFINPRTQQWVHPERSGFFHLDISCLQNHDNTLEIRAATITDDLFMKLSRQHLDFLHGEGILEHISRNKRKSI